MVQGKTQGPCTIRQFREWLRHMRGDRNLHEELKRFSDVSVWRVGPLAHPACSLVTPFAKSLHLLCFHQIIALRSAWLGKVQDWIRTFPAA